MAFHNVPPNGFPDIPDIEDLEAVQGDVNVLKSDVSELKSGLTNVDVALSVPVGSGKNLIPLSLDNYKTYSTTGTWVGNVYSVNGIDFTVNTDANGAVTSISASGTASALAMLELTMAGKKGAYTLNGCPSGGSAGYYVQIYKSGFIDVKDRGDGVAVNFESDKNVRVICAIGEGLEVTDLTFYPMLRDARISDATYAPYIPSVENRLVKITKESFEQITVNAGSKKFVTNVGLLTDNIVVTAYSDNSDVIAYVATATTTYQVYLYNPTNAAVTSNITVMVAKV